MPKNLLQPDIGELVPHEEQTILAIHGALNLPKDLCYKRIKTLNDTTQHYMFAEGSGF